jgi:hypothetical protein
VSKKLEKLGDLLKLMEKDMFKVYYELVKNMMDAVIKDQNCEYMTIYGDYEDFLVDEVLEKAEKLR